jgi:hypothetical protein
MRPIVLDDDAFEGRERIIEHLDADEFSLDDLPDAFATNVDGIERPPGGETLIRRATNGRPYIFPLGPDGLPVLTQKTYTYTRVTTFIDKIDDNTNIHKWEMRHLLAILSTPEGEGFLLEAASYDPESMTYREKMNELVIRVLERAGTKDRAAKGTAVHAITERSDMGMNVSRIPTKYHPHLAAYREFTQHFEMVEIEKFVVNDDYETGGTPDRVVQYKPCKHCGCEYYIEDLKTGRVDNYTELAIAMQLALYAHSKKYNIETGERIDLPPLCPHKGIVVHLPAHSSDPFTDGGVKWVNIARGWKYVDLCARIAKARAEKNMVVPFEPTTNVWSILRLCNTQFEVRRVFEVHREEFDLDERLHELMALRMEDLS